MAGQGKAGQGSSPTLSTAARPAVEGSRGALCGGFVGGCVGACTCLARRIIVFSATEVDVSNERPATTLSRPAGFHNVRASERWWSRGPCEARCSLPFLLDAAHFLSYNEGVRWIIPDLRGFGTRCGGGYPLSRGEARAARSLWWMFSVAADTDVRVLAYHSSYTTGMGVADIRPVSPCHPPCHTIP